MSLDLYDKALYKKISEVFPNVINSAEESVFDNLSEGKTNINTKEKQDEVPKVMFPLISFWRTGNPPNMLGDGEGNYSSILRGRYIEIKEKRVRVFPISITYQLSIWSDRRKEVDDIYREFLMMFFVDNPYLKVEVEEEYIEEFSLQLIDSTTNIDTTSFLEKGRLYRQDIIIELPNAKLFYDGESSELMKNIDLRNIIKI